MADRGARDARSHEGSDEKDESELLPHERPEQDDDQENPHHARAQGFNQGSPIPAHPPVGQAYEEGSWKPSREGENPSRPDGISNDPGDKGGENSVPRTYQASRHAV